MNSIPQQPAATSYTNPPAGNAAAARRPGTSGKAILLVILGLVGILACGLAVNIAWVAYSAPKMFATVDAGAQQYASVALPWMQRYEAALDDFNRLAGDAAPDDPAWREAMRSCLNHIEAVDSEIFNYKPPYLFQAWHLGVTDFAREYEQLADGYWQGVEARDTHAMDSARSTQLSADDKRKQFEATMTMLKEEGFSPFLGNK
jgi:hypothetical protein